MADTMIVVDRVEAVVIGPEGTDVITLSDTRRPSIDGRLRTLDAQIEERKMYQDAKANHLVDPEAVDKQLKILQRDNNLSVDGMNDAFRAAGYTPEEGKEQFAVMTGVNNIIGMKVSSKVMVSDQEVVDSYNKAPEMLEESYCLKRAEIPLTQAASTGELKKQLKERELKPEWTSEYWINRSEIDEAKSFVFAMPKGQMHIDKTQYSYELLRLVDKEEVRAAPLDANRRLAIENDLRQSKFSAGMRAYHQELDEANAVIRF